MFKVGDKVFDNERGYGEGVVSFVYPKTIIVDFCQASHVSYTHDGRWLTHMEQSLFKKEEKMKNYYYVGQKVSHQAFGDGVVVDTESGNSYYPIKVEFNDYIKSFTVDGRGYRNELPTLSQKPHVPLELKEIVTFEKGELVWVKSVIWQARYYSHFDGEQHYYFINQQGTGSFNKTDEIRKFSDNPLTLNYYK